MRSLIYRTPAWVTVFLISLASALAGLTLVPFIYASPSETIDHVIALVVIPSFFIAMLVSSPVVITYRKIIHENYEMIEMLKRDQLTGLPNRQTFFAIYEEKVAKLKVDQKSIALIMLDIDDFKSINDNYGHPAGDMAIEHLARQIEQNIRAGDLLCRFGGEEFLIVLTDLNSNQAIDCANRILETSRTKIHYEGSCIPYTSSIGLAFFQICNGNSDCYISKADKALYQAKSQGKNRVVSCMV